jgi:hypothetical protein
MRAQSIVEIQISTERGARDANAAVGVQVDLFVFDRFPDALDEDIVAPRALAVHADRDFVGDQNVGEGLAGELAVLKISGLPCFARASSSASTQKSACIVIDTRWLSTRRLNQSTTAVR